MERDFVETVYFYTQITVIRCTYCLIVYIINAILFVMIFI